MKLLLHVSTFFALILAIPTTSVSCSMQACNDRGIELRSDFTLTVRHDGKPLPEVTVQIHGTSEAGVPQFFSDETKNDGAAHFVSLPPGDYWLSTDLFGSSAGSECFHVNSHPSRKSKKSLHYDWGDEVLAFRQAAGTFIDSQPGKGRSPIQNLLHRVQVPVGEAVIQLREPIKGTIYRTLTDGKGHFAFENVPDGTYVLSIVSSSGPESHTLDVEGILVQIAETAKLETISLVHRDAGGGSCEGTGIELH